MTASLAEVYAALGATPQGEGGWATTPHGEIVVAMRRERLVGRGDELRYEPTPSDFADAPLVEALRHARDHRGGVIGALLLGAGGVHAEGCAPYPHPMRVVELDVATGAFTLARPLKPKG